MRLPKMPLYATCVCTGILGAPRRLAATRMSSQRRMFHSQNLRQSSISAHVPKRGGGATSCQLRYVRYHAVFSACKLPYFSCSQRRKRALE